MSEVMIESENNIAIETLNKIEGIDCNWNDNTLSRKQNNIFRRDLILKLKHAGLKQFEIAEVLVPKVSQGTISNVLKEYENGLENKAADLVNGGQAVRPQISVRNKKVEEIEYSELATVFEDMDSYVDMIIGDIQPSLLITGMPGLGKTYLVEQRLKAHGYVEYDQDKPTQSYDYVVIKGKSTPAAMFRNLYLHSDKLIIFDDCDSVFKNDDAVNILKGALDSYDVRKISWQTQRPLTCTVYDEFGESRSEEIPQTFAFDGRVLFISNLHKNKVDPAVRSRSFVIDITLTERDVIQRMEEILPNMEKNTSIEIKEKALASLKINAKENEGKIEVNMRSLIKAIRIANLSDIDEVKMNRLIMQQCKL